jgi:hypothetical protein
MELTCPNHPHYKGIKMSKAGDSACAICEKLYALKHQIEAEVAKNASKPKRAI